jgi:hypothetical protein
MGPVHTIRKQFIFGDMVSVIFFQLPLVFLVLFHTHRLATSRSHFCGKHRPRLKALQVICIFERFAVAIASLTYPRHRPTAAALDFFGSGTS